MEIINFVTFNNRCLNILNNPLSSYGCSYADIFFKDIKYLSLVSFV